MAYGGELLIKNAPDAEPMAIAPLFNRAVIMLTDRYTYHGYRKMHLPPGVTRKSVATYAYEKFEVGSIRPLTTGWHRNPLGLASASWHHSSIRR